MPIQPLVTEVATHCPYCALQCGMTLRTIAGGGVEVAPRDFPTNRGGLCQKGWTSAELLDHPERLTTPLIRDAKGATLRPATWDEALARITTELRSLRATLGPDAVAVFGGGGLTNEKAYALGKFARAALGTRFIDYNGRFCMSSAAAAGNRAFGVDRGMPFPLADLGHADVLILVGANPAETMPPLARYLHEQRAGGGKLIVVDPRVTPTARLADIHLQTLPGTDLALANALLHLVIAADGVDTAYVDTRTRGYDDVAATVVGYWPERVERMTGVPVADLRRVAELLGRAERAIILTARGAEQHAKGTDTATAWINLALACGLPGRPGSGYGCITGQGNGQGGREHGQKSDQLPGYRSIADPAAREHVAGVWGIDAAALPVAGVPAMELFDLLGTDAGPKALLIFGSNPVVSTPRAARVQRRLESLDLLVVADLVRSETAEIADVVLPTAQWAEEDGTMTNLEGRVIRRRKLRPAPDGVRTDLDIISALATSLDAPGVWPTDPAIVFTELRRATAGGRADYNGIDWDRVDDEQGVFWPCPTSDHPGTPRMFTERFATDDGRARFVAVEHRPAVEEPDAAYPYYLTTGRVLAQYQSGAQTRRIGALRDAAPGGFVEIHPDAASAEGISDGENVRVVSRRGIVDVPARVVDTIRADTLFLPFHWGGPARANSATNDARDPISGMPEFKVCAARLERLP